MIKMDTDGQVKTEPEPKFSEGDSVFGVKSGVSYMIVSVDRYSREDEQFFYNVRKDDSICSYSVRESDLRYTEEIIEKLKNNLMLLNDD